MTKETHRGMWGALRPAIRRTSAEELLHARRAEIKASEPTPYTGAFGRIAADVPTVAEEPDLPTGSVPVVPARSKLREQGVGTRVRTRTNVSTGFVPLVRDSKTTPKNPTLSDLNRETMQKAAEAEAKNAVEAQTIDTAEAASASTAGRKYRTETTRTGHTHTVADPNAPLSSLAASPEAAERAAAREDAVEDTPRFLKLRATLIALTVPLTVLMIAIRTVASAPFLWFEYHRPGFPEDSYGYYLIERMRLGSYGVDYINNFAPREYLARVTTGADNTLAFTEAEVNHMHDVKWVLLVAIIAVAALFLLTLFSSISLRERSPGTIRRSLFSGAWITLGLIAVLGVMGFFNWEWLFTTFHQVFFPQGNWEFSVRSSLIRLYPPQFWIDAAIAVAVLMAAQITLLLVATWPTKYRKLKAERRRQERQELRVKLASARVGDN
ncbi:TIGR01906 family membrane protein [Rothia similmucilaginosa]|uniref:TIGR01906 family membrane protein n=1 Tax=unclassified Rothia (in: high G+C Gram-positive bacteria) TaxID=2689056 RepID=UPI0024494F24|nr:MULTISPECIES: TIGR01906 family membrane protein [unclassified Rothia (in: high G+C Gram-positive bacteria)]